MRQIDGSAAGYLAEDFFWPLQRAVKMQKSHRGGPAKRNIQILRVGRLRVYVQ